MAKNIFLGGASNKAQKTKGIYIGAPTEVIEDEVITKRTLLPKYTMTADKNEIARYFTIANDTDSFIGKDQNVSQWEATNLGKNSTTALTILTAKYDLSYLSFGYAVTSETNYDKLTIKVSGVAVVDAISGIQAPKTWTGSLLKGQKIEITYSKDGSSSAANETAYFSDLTISTVLPGTPVAKDIARKVKKAYIGVEGKAKLCYAVPPKIVSWANGRDEEIVEMVRAADEGVINLTDYWNVGDERQVRLSAMPATYVGEGQYDQTVTFVLMDIGREELANLTHSGRRFCSFIVGQKDCLDNTGGMNLSYEDTNTWEDCARRKWCNEIYKNAIPKTLSPIFKQFKKYTGKYTYTGWSSTLDYWVLPTEVEVLGEIRESSPKEDTFYNQIEYYKSSINRIKKINGTAKGWRLSSPLPGSTAYFCGIGQDGSAYRMQSNHSFGIAPYGVI